MENHSDLTSDAQREQMVLSLRQHLLDGRLTLDEFAERVEIAYAARRGADLIKAGESLPPVTADAPGARRKPARITTAIFGDVERRGRLRLRGHSLAISMFADLDLDLREAEIDESETRVTGLVGFGNLDIYVPERVNVDVSGVTVFGRRREWGRDLSSANAPIIHVRVLGCFATIDVWRVPHEMRGSYGEITRHLCEQQRRLPA